MKTSRRALWGFGRGRIALAIAVTLAAGPLLTQQPASAATGPTFIGPVLSYAENGTVSWGRDGGFSVPLPNGKVFWVFADTPRYEYLHGKWQLNYFIPGSTAGEGTYKKGGLPTGRFMEVHPSGKLASSNKPAIFMPNPFSLVMPDGSGKPCTKTNGGVKANPVRWPTGAALMPNKTNILISYLMVCVIKEQVFQAEGWGFTLFNWKTNRFATKPNDVLRPQPNGASISTTQFFGSPIILNNRVTFYSWACCGAGSGVYTTTIPANVTSLRNRALYEPVLIPNSPATYELGVAPKSPTHSTYTMYATAGSKGQYTLLTATDPAGPWKQVASGSLPRCNTSPKPCHSIAVHPEFGAKSRLVVSYHLPGYGPGVATEHPYPHDPLRHVVLASLPCNC